MDLHLVNRQEKIRLATASALEYGNAVFGGPVMSGLMYTTHLRALRYTLKAGKL